MSINLRALGYKSGNEKLSGHGDEARASINMSLSRSVNLCVFGYSRHDDDRTRSIALQKAIDTHGVWKVLDRLNQIKASNRKVHTHYTRRVNYQNVYTGYTRQVAAHLVDTEADIKFVLSINPEDDDDDYVYLPLPPLVIDKPSVVVRPVPKWRQDENRNARFNECMKYLNLKQGYSRRA